MTISTTDRLNQIHADAITEFDDIQRAQREGRMECLSDRRFYSISGAQWEGQLADQFENKPKFEVNKVHLAVIRIINEYRNNRITVNFTPKDGETNADFASVCDDLYRADENDSVAEEAYDNAFEEAVGGGYGAWRLRAAYEDDEDPDNTKQRVRLEPIFDADASVFFNLDAKRQDKADSKRCYVITSMTPKLYTETYKDDPASWPKEVYQGYFDWATPLVVYVCELYKVEEVSSVVHVFRGLDEQDMFVPDAELKDDPDKLNTLLATGFREVRQKRVKSRKVHKYIMSGSKVLEDCGYIAGKCIPIVPVYGKRWFVDNIERQMGHVRLAKDMQRLMNMQISKAAEISALSSVEKPILTPQQINGHTQMWANDNIVNNPYLLVNEVTSVDGQVQPLGPLSYTRAPNIPPAMAALFQLTDANLSDILGNQEAGEQVQPNMSGRAVDLVQQRLDMQVFIYMSNMAKAMKRSGEIWLSMSRDIVTEEKRQMKTVTSQDQVSTVTLNEPDYDADTGQESVKNDMTEATFDVWSNVGPSSSSRRAATVRALTGMMSLTQDPATQAVLSNMVMMNIEGEGISEAREYFRMQLVKGGIIKATPEEQAELDAAAKAQAQQPPDANSQYLLAAAKAQEAKARKDEAGVLDTLADADLKVAQAHETEGKTAAAHVQQTLDVATTLRDLAAPPPT